MAGLDELGRASEEEDQQKHLNIGNTKALGKDQDGTSTA
jgi:hypothetical protein